MPLFGTRFPVSGFVVQTLSIFYDNYVSLRISAFHDCCWKTQWCLEKDCLVPENLERDNILMLALIF